ncbi:MAG: VWA domain-containing protein [Bacteroidales bacterium]|nr:VWA domain-containing protein [Bacteroidales bacterium]
MMGYKFANPEFLYLNILLIPIIVWYILKYTKGYPTISLSTTAAFANMRTGFRTYLRHLLFVFRIAALTLIIIVLSRPQSHYAKRDVITEGIDIVLALDVSRSMLARDFKPDRIEAAKEVAIKFVTGRDNDRIGLVVFSGESFTQCPLTTDKAVLINLINQLESGMIEDGTAIGLGLANAITRLKESSAKSKVVILITDGVNNSGELSPLTAAELAKTFGIRVYTVGIGSQGTAPYPVQTMFGIQYQQMKVEIDEKTLTEIANTTDGKYFRAKSKVELESIYEHIDMLEKTKIKVHQYSQKEEQFYWFGLIALLLISVEMLLKYTILRHLP